MLVAGAVLDRVAVGWVVLELAVGAVQAQWFQQQGPQTREAAVAGITPHWLVQAQQAAQA
jgi:hypothetical protein